MNDGDLLYTRENWCIEVEREPEVKFVFFDKAGEEELLNC